MATLVEWAILVAGVGGMVAVFLLMSYVRSYLRNIDSDRCPACGARVKSSFSHCPHCGAELDQ